eukprot:GEZU01006699.1.p1 GENE.GEZU01006699.1~~GEZU01006699.1.p1  ORF type:complete len:1421 (-),score=302.07 GEZU01006699.1:215-4477(-)
MDQYPKELTRDPVAVIALVGLTSLHPNIIETVKSSTKCETPLNFLSLESENDVRRKKDKRPFEGYKPAGILKSDWLRKYQEVIPACIVLLNQFDLDTDWRVQESTILGTIEKLKSKIRTRGTRLILCLVSNKSPAMRQQQPITTPTSPSNSNNQPTLEDFLNGLKKKCDLETKSSIITFSTQEPTSSARKIEKAISELYTLFYKDEIKRVKKYKNEVSKINQPGLLVRHRFKLAYWSEVLRDTNRAEKYYDQAYESLKEVSRKDYSETEIKNVGDWINFKICKLKLLVSDTRQVEPAVKRFLAHIHWFTKYPGEPELLFEHYALIYKQYRMFGEMLERMSKNQLSPTDRYQNPGYYYQAAASAATTRKKCAQGLCEPHRANIEKLTASDPSILSNENREDAPLYVGQRGNFEGATPVLVQQMKERIFMRECAKELKFDHSAVIIDMLNKAYEHFKKHDLSRMILYIASCMAEEYFSSQKYDVAKRFLDRIAKSYKKEMWTDILTLISQRSLECAKHLNLPKDYIEHALELISSEMGTAVEARRSLLNQILTFVETPANTTLPFAPLQAPLQYDLEHDHISLRCKVQFSKPHMSVYDTVLFTVQITSRAPDDIRFHRLQVTFSDSNYNISIAEGEKIPVPTTLKQGTDDKPGKLAQGSELAAPQESNNNSTKDNGGEVINLLVPGNEVPAYFSFPLVIKENKDLECLSVSLQLGSSSTSSLQLRWKYTDNKHFKALLNDYNFRHEVGSGDFVERPVIRVNAPQPNLTCSFVHLPPALINEYYSFGIVLQSNTDHILQGSLTLFPTENVVFYDSKFARTEVFNFGEIQPHMTHKIPIHLRCSTPGVKELRLLITYKTTLFNNNLTVDETFNVWAQYPFDAQFRFMSTRGCSNSTSIYQIVPNNIAAFLEKTTDTGLTFAKISFSPADSLKAATSGTEVKTRYNEGFAWNEPILLFTSLVCNTPYPVILKSIELETSNVFVCETDKRIDVSNNAHFELEGVRTDSVNGKVIRKTVLEHHDAYSFNHTLLPVPTSPGTLETSPGTMIITCERYTKQGEPVEKRDVIFKFPLPPLTLYDAMLVALYDFPPEGVMGAPMPVTLTILNNTILVQEVHVSVRDSEAFFFAGSAEVTVSILPNETRVLRYTMIPVLSGHVSFPQFVITAKRNDTHVLHPDEKWSIFVRPDTPLVTATKPKQSYTTRQLRAPSIEKTKQQEKMKQQAQQPIETEHQQEQEQEQHKQEQGQEQDEQQEQGQTPEAVEAPEKADNAAAIDVVVEEEGDVGGAAPITPPPPEVIQDGTDIELDIAGAQAEEEHQQIQHEQQQQQEEEAAAAAATATATANANAATTEMDDMAMSEDISLEEEQSSAAAVSSETADTNNDNASAEDESNNKQPDEPDVVSGGGDEYVSTDESEATPTTPTTSSY